MRSRSHTICSAQIYTKHKLPHQTIVDVRNPTTSKNPNRKKRMEALLTPGEIWPNARVPYQLSTEYSSLFATSFAIIFHKYFSCN
jgi:hypothetical protein